jgi:hypothetical protein
MQHLQLCGHAGRLARLGQRLRWTILYVYELPTRPIATEHREASGDGIENG